VKSLNNKYIKNGTILNEIYKDQNKIDLMKYIQRESIKEKNDKELNLLRDKQSLISPKLDKNDIDIDIITSIPSPEFLNKVYKNSDVFSNFIKEKKKEMSSDPKNLISII